VADLSHASGQADALLSSLESRHVSEKVDQLITSGRDTAAQADESVTQIHQIISEVATPDERGISAGTNIRESLTNANTSTGNLADETEALKHNFLLKGFFRKRGYYNVNQLSAEKYRNDRFFTSPVNYRAWLSGPELFQKSSSGLEELSPRGKMLLDSAITQSDRPSLEGPIVVEGYWNGDDPVDRIALSRVRAILVSQYLENHFHIESENIGIVSMRNSPPTGLGHSSWDGICIVVPRKA
jgi:phospholipid/cholesterol/gamma-HCH transport system substrate-binding protein